MAEWKFSMCESRICSDSRTSAILYSVFPQGHFCPKNEKRKTKNEKQKTKNEKRKTKNEKRKTKNEKRKTKNEK